MEAFVLGEEAELPAWVSPERVRDDISSLHIEQRAQQQTGPLLPRRHRRGAQVLNYGWHRLALLSPGG